ncbi:MAG: hypothetical protein CMF57_12865 [Leifsonia sp.]|nr:hypothetical protein [Leifsonia sp.]
MGDGVGMIGMGYEGLSIEEFCSHVSTEGVSVVVDVRLNALSRKPGFSKNGLRAALAEAGVDYLHFPVLGNPRDNRDGFALPGSRAGDAARNRYRASISTADAMSAIAEITALASARVVGVMCFEKEQHECHRELVIERVEAALHALHQPAGV